MPMSEPSPGRRPTTEVQRANREMRRAERLARNGQVPEAIESLLQALQYGADRYTCYLRLARLYQMRRQWPQAVHAAEMAIEVSPDKITAREAVIALYLECRDYTRAIEASIALLKLAPRHVPARDALGAAYIGLGDVEAAMRVANDLIRMDPTNPTHRFTKAHLCQHRGEIRLAVDEFERVIQFAPDTELAESARDQLDVLDSFQINQILLLATEDAVFRARLVQDPDFAPVERGYYLSETGRHALHELIGQGLDEITPSARPNLYN